MRNETTQWTYSDELAAAICERIGEGKSLRSICADPAMPDDTTVMEWLDRHTEFLDLYTLTIAMLVQDIAYECIEIVDDRTLTLAQARMKTGVRHWMIDQLERSPRYDKSRCQPEFAFPGPATV